MRILFLGDVVGISGCSKIMNNLLDQIKVNEIGKPMNIAKSITPTNMKPKTAGSINSEIIYFLQAIHLF